MENSKKRGWVKNAVIIFLAVMLILTFFSNTIMNYSLPEVAAQYATSGSITAKIRTSANAKANSTHDIVIEESRKVKAVAVRDGQMVEIGDVLFYLDDAESSELKGAREALEALQKEYQLKLLTLDEDFYAEELAIIEKQQELADARTVLASLSENKAQVDSLDAKITELEKRKKEIAKSISAYETEIAKLQGGAANGSLIGESTAKRLENAKAAYDKALENYKKLEAEKNSAELALESVKEAYKLAEKEYKEETGGADINITALREEIDELEKQMRRAKEDYNIARDKLSEELSELKEQMNDAEDEYNSIKSQLENGAPGVTQDDVDDAKEAYEAAQSEYNDEGARIKEEQASLKLAYERQREDDNDRLDKLESQLDGADDASYAAEKFEAASEELEAASEYFSEKSEAFGEAETELAKTKSEYEALMNLSSVEGYEKILDALNDQLEACEEEIETTREKAEALGANTDEKTQQALVKSIESELATMQHNLNRRRQEQAVDDRREQLEINDLLTDISEQKALVAKYEAASTDAKICAEVAGQVTSLTVGAGMETAVGQTMCQIVATDLGYICEVELSAEQARRVRVGDKVEVTNSWWADISGTITSIRNDPKNPGVKKIAVISLSGEVSPGQNLSLTIGEKGQSYDTLVPNSAVREDNNGKFVLVVEAKSSPLGNRYIARRYDVEVLASDDTNSAVSGLMGSEFIITTSTKPLVNGNQVRLIEN